MKCKGCWWFMVGLVLGAANVVWAQSQSKDLSINLKARSLVIGPKILLHEICFIQTDNREIRQKIGAVQLGKAPPPGESKELTLSFIKQQLRQAGLQKYLDKISGPKVIRVTTAHQEISKAVLEDAVTEYVREHAPGVDFRIELNRLPEKLCAPQTDYRLEVKPAGRFAGRGHQAFRVGLIGQGEEVASWSLAATIHAFQEVAVAKERLPRHHEIGEQALAFEYRDIRRVSGTPLSREAFSRTLRTKVIVEPGTVIAAGMVEPPPLVERGKIVRLIVAAGNVEISTVGRAQDSGQLAEAVKVRPLGNGKILRGEVAGVDVVRVVL
jgi:flagella basal body P-ring formation protein FlgA